MKKDEHDHAEAFAIMQYECEECGEVERLWNSRDGVTPFIISSECCNAGAQHIAWEEDVYDPNHVPEVGDRIFVDITPEIAEPKAEKYVDKYWEGDGSDATPPMKNQPFAQGKTKYEVVLLFVDQWCQKRGGSSPPAVVEVTSEMQSNFLQRKV